MYNYFYHFYRKRLADGLYSRAIEDVTPSPPSSQERITEDGIERITEDGEMRITE